jgi:hypothetical protein
MIHRVTLHVLDYASLLVEENRNAPRTPAKSIPKNLKSSRFPHQPVSFSGSRDNMTLEVAR